MSQKYISIPHGDLGSGIDQLSSEDNIQENYSEGLVNFDASPEGYISKRPGWQGAFGFLPVRVTSVTYSEDSTQNLSFFLDSSIDLTKLASQSKSRPLVVFGRTSKLNAANAGDFPAGQDTVRYYPISSGTALKTFLPGTNTLNIPRSVHGLASPYIWVGVTASTDVLSSDNSLFIPDEVLIDATTDDVSVVYTNNTGAEFQGYVYLLDRSPLLGTNFVSASTPVAPGTQTFSFNAATHQLSNRNILVKCYQLALGVYREVRLEEVLIDTSDTVTVSLKNSTASSFNCIFLLSSAPAPQVVQGSVLGQSSITVSLPMSTPFPFVSCYLEQTLGGTYEEVRPDSISVIGTTASVTFQNESSDPLNFFVVWESASVTSNILTVDAAVLGPGEAFTDTSPQLTIWGLDHSSLYKDSAASRAGWVTHLDTYQAVGERFLVSGLGGNLFSGQNADTTTSLEYQIPSLYPSLRARAVQNSVIAPAFCNTFSVNQRSSGCISADNFGSFAQPDSITWDSGTGLVQVLIPLVNGQVHGTLSNIIDTSTNFEDRLTIQASGYTELNGEWPIRAVTATLTLLTLLVDIPSVVDSLTDDIQSGAQVGILTDRIFLADTSEFIPGDVILSQIQTNQEQVTCRASLGNVLLVGGISDELAFPAGIRIAGKRTSNVLPLRTLGDVASVEGVVMGDNLSLSGDPSYLREFRVLDVNSLADRAITIDGDGSLATVTLLAGTTEQLAMGQSLLLVNAGDFSGAVEIQTVTSDSSFQFNSAVEGTGITGTVLGHTVTLDESVEWADSVSSGNQASVPGRWLPFEAPNTSWNETPGPYVHYLNASTYDNQPILRSSHVTDSLILNNGQDRALKIDGLAVYRPGLPRWQAQAFITIDTTDPTIAIPSVSTSTLANGTAYIPGTSPWALDGYHFYVDAAFVDTFPVGATISANGGKTIYTVSSTRIVTSPSGTNSYGVITVSEAIKDTPPTGVATGTLAQKVSYSYYFRLNAVDINDNVVASAATGSENWTIKVSADFTAHIRLIGMPALDVYDYDRLEVQIYRTKGNGVAPYFLLTTLPMSFNATEGYIDYLDTSSDDQLVDLDKVNTALKGQELGTGWSPPIRSECLTSASNRLVLGNLTSDPFIDFRIYKATGEQILLGDLTGKKFLLRKDSTDTGTATDMQNRANFQFTNSESGAVSNVSIATGAAFTVTTGAAHGLVSGNWVYLFRDSLASKVNTTFMGWWQVSSAPTSTTFTVKWTGTSASTPPWALGTDVNGWVKATDANDIPVFLGDDYGYQTASVLAGTAAVESQAFLRWSNAVNATQRMVDRSLSGQTGFQPWIVADSGGEFAAGEIIFRQSMNQPTGQFFSLVLPADSAAYNMYINNVQADAGSSNAAVSSLFPSRILVSYRNFPEIFDSPLAQVDSFSDSAIDINPSDGQPITAVIPFYGDSSFGAALKDSVILVFKTNSIYLVNVAAKVAGENPVQRIESMGLGCTAPYSVTPTRDGVMFANESGIYKLQMNQTVYYMGRHVQRLWRQGVNLQQLSLAFGHNWTSGSQYKLSAPPSGQSVPAITFVYNNTREYTRQNEKNPYGTPEGSWNQHAGYTPIGYANLGTLSYYASLSGRVFGTRNTRLVTDYRDDASAIAASATLRAMDFGDDGVRKNVPYALITFRNPPLQGLRLGVVVSSSVDLSNQFSPADKTTIEDWIEDTGTGDYESQRIVTYRYSFNQKRGIRFQLLIEDSTKDEPIEISKIRYTVAGLTAGGTRNAASGPSPKQQS
jgi:hypothetical protein